MTPLASLQRPFVKPAPIVELNDRERSQYSITRAILAADNLGHGYRRPTVGGFELEISQEIARHLPPNVSRHGGLFIPTHQLELRAGLDSASTGKGKELVYTEAVSFIDALRNRTTVLSLGATMLMGLIDNAAFPGEAAPATATWVAENPGADLANNDLTLNQIISSPKILQGTHELLEKAVGPVDAGRGYDCAERLRADQCARDRSRRVAWRRRK